LHFAIVEVHTALSVPSSAAPPAKKKCGAGDDDSTNEEPEIVAEKVEGLSLVNYAVLLPLIAGFTFSPLYFIIKWLHWKILSYYLLPVSVVSARFLQYLVSQVNGGDSLFQRVSPVGCGVSEALSMQSAPQDLRPSVTTTQ
jgi:hypothetical protein